MIGVHSEQVARSRVFGDPFGPGEALNFEGGPGVQGLPADREGVFFRRLDPIRQDEPRQREVLQTGLHGTAASAPGERMMRPVFPEELSHFLGQVLDVARAATIAIRPGRRAASAAWTGLIRGRLSQPLVILLEPWRSVGRSPGHPDKEDDQQQPPKEEQQVEEQLLDEHRLYLTRGTPGAAKARSSAPGVDSENAERKSQKVKKSKSQNVKKSKADRERMWPNARGPRRRNAAGTARDAVAYRPTLNLAEHG